jgi:putative NADPH-quinone reductase
MSTHPRTPDTRRILILQGHPDGTARHLGHALAEAYAEGARTHGHEVRTLTVADLDFPLLRSQADWNDGPVPPALAGAQEAIAWSQHLVLFFPLWLGDMPALVKAFLEQVARPGFAIGKQRKGGMATKLLKGRSARVVVTMGMPALVYRWYFRAHSLKALERNILGFVGFAPVHETLIGQVQGMSAGDAQAWFEKMRRLGAKAG